MVARPSTDDKSQRRALPRNLDDEIGPLRLPEDANPCDIGIAIALRLEGIWHRDCARDYIRLVVPTRRQFRVLTSMLKNDLAAAGETPCVERPKPLALGERLNRAHVKVELGGKQTARARQSAD